MFVAIFWIMKNYCPLKTEFLLIYKHSACLLAEIFFDPEDGGDIFLRNIGCISTDYTASHPRR
jgi:hypothetical protein